MVHCVSPFMRKVRTAAGATAVQVSRSLPRTSAPPDPGAHRLHESLAERANTLIKRITHNPRAITTITVVAPVILTPLMKGNLMKNLGADSAVRLAPLVWL